NAGHDLEHKTQQRATTEHIKPTAGTGRHRVARGRSEEPAHPESLIDPKGDFSQHTRFLFAAGLKAVQTTSEVGRPAPKVAPAQSYIRTGRAHAAVARKRASRRHKTRRRGRDT